MPGDGQASTQKQIVEDFLAKGVNGIAISPIDPGIKRSFWNPAASQGVAGDAGQRCAECPIGYVCGDG